MAVHPNVVVVHPAAKNIGRRVVKVDDGNMAARFEVVPRLFDRRFPAGVEHRERIGKQDEVDRFRQAGGAGAVGLFQQLNPPRKGSGRPRSLGQHIRRNVDPCQPPFGVFFGQPAQVEPGAATYFRYRQMIGRGQIIQ